jgi:large subunit ribosomal protein L31e
MKVEHIVIDASINEKIWERGIQKIPSKIKVKATVIEEDDEKFVKAVLAE